MRLEPPLKSEYLAWRASPITKFFIQLLFDKREAIKEGIAEGQSANVDLEIGRTQSLKDAIDCAISGFDGAVIEEEEKVDD